MEANALADPPQDTHGAGYGSRAELNLTAEQRGKIAEIQNDLRRKHWDLMAKSRKNNRR